ncbi:helix-turn-helix domain-containing protein [Embleya sp. NPDC059237]|uniref:helix-turn-helix domain-containing protein n=1 Tax=unclassified Embleya TaxID=2699296 RepID=UPI0036942B72
MRPAANQKKLGEELRRLRVERGLTVDAASTRVGWDKSKLSRLETNKTLIGKQHVDALAEALGLTSAMRLRLDRLLGVETGESGIWWGRYQDVLTPQYEELILLESQAASIEVAAMLIPGLMQAPGYAQATLLQSAFVPDPEDAEMLLDVRRRRQQVVTAGAVSLLATLSESVLLNAFCGRVALQRQLQYLLDLGQLPNVTLRIVPYDAPGAAFTGTVTLLDPQPEAGATVAYVEYEGGSQLLSDSRTIKRYRRNLAYFGQAACSEAESRRMISERLEDS